MKKNILAVLSLVSLMSLSLSANAAIDYKAGLKAGAKASLANTKPAAPANTQAINSYRTQIKNVTAKSNKLSADFNKSVNGASALLLSKDELAKVRGNSAANSAAAADKLAAYLAADSQKANISKKVNSLSADKRAQLNGYAVGMKNSMVEYTKLTKEATTLSINVAKTPSVAAALSPELKSLRQVSTNASNQAKTAGKISTALLGVRK